MANELNIGLTTGRTITARLILNGAYVGSAITCPETPANSGHYSGSVPGGTGAGHYSVLFLEGSTIIGSGSLVWNGTAERTLLDLPTVAQVEARTLPSADYFNPATDTVATVTSLTNAVVLPPIPANWITASGLNSDAIQEIQSGFPTIVGLPQETLDTLTAILSHTSYIANAVEAQDIQADISALITARTLPSAEYFNPLTDLVKIDTTNYPVIN